MINTLYYRFPVVQIPSPALFSIFTGENYYFLFIKPSSNLVFSDESKEIKLSYHFML
jgi:hypothetical protein